MYRIMITDDESIIVDGLFEFIHSRRADDYDVVRAYSGKEAHAIMERMRIDIVVTDIEMPVENGIAVHEVIQKKWPRSKTIFLTAYKNFDYIYYSSKFQNTKFILKSEGFDALLKLLDATAEEISRELVTGRLLSGGNEKYNENVLIYTGSYDARLN